MGRSFVDQRRFELLTSPVRVVLAGTAADQPWLFRVDQRRFELLTSPVRAGAKRVYGRFRRFTDRPICACRVSLFPLTPTYIANHPLTGLMLGVC